MQLSIAVHLSQDGFSDASVVPLADLGNDASAVEWGGGQAAYIPDSDQ